MSKYLLLLLVLVSGCSSTPKTRMRNCIPIPDSLNDFLCDDAFPKEIAPPRSCEVKHKI